MSEAAVRVSFRILGRMLSAHGVDAHLATWLARHWDRPHLEVPGHPFVIDLRCAPRPELPAELLQLLPERTSGHDDGATPRRASGDDAHASVLLGSHEGGAYLELDAARARVQAWGVRGPSPEGRWPLLLALHEAVRASGLLPLHCAAAVHPDEAGATALLGPSGVGKSTTLLALAQAGWAPVCEDFAWLDPTNGMVHAWDHGLRLRPDALERLGHGSAPTPSDPAAEKQLVAYHDLGERYGVRRCVSAPLRRLVRLVRGDGPTRWEALPRTHAVPVLWESIGLPLTTPARRQVAAHIAAIVDEAELLNLHLGRTPVPAAPAS